MLTIERMKVDYGSFTALDIEETVTILGGDRVGIIGSNGAGKTTLVKAVAGLVDYKGSIKTELKREDIALHLQENTYIKRMPVKLLIEAVFNTDVYKNQRLKEIIDFFDFEPCLAKRVAQLSGGQKQKLTVIMILFLDRPLTVFDEVTSGLDFESRQKLMQKVAEWYEGKDNAVCVVSHYYDELESLVNKLLIIDKGRLVDFGEVDGLFKKYCGSAVLIIKNTPENEKAVKGFERIKAPRHLLAFPCASVEAEKELTSLFIRNDINYKRSNKDIEILFVNAVGRAAGEENENE